VIKDKMENKPINKNKYGKAKNFTKNEVIIAPITQAICQLEKYSHQELSDLSDSVVARIYHS